MYRASAQEAIARASERQVETKSTPSGTVTRVHLTGWQLKRHAQWLALATIDAFFSWTEHVFIHIAILTGRIRTGIEVAELAEAEWQSKFKRALDLGERETKALFDQLVEIRRQYRNFVAHGAFGKQGEAFHFHSGAGAVPVLLPHRAGQRRFTITNDLAFDDAAAMVVIEQFVDHLWSGKREPARLYIQDAALPAILTNVANGTYDRAMQSAEEMEEYVSFQTRQIDDAANMDW